MNRYYVVKWLIIHGMWRWRKSIIFGKVFKMNCQLIWISKTNEQIIVWSKIELIMAALLLDCLSSPMVTYNWMLKSIFPGRAWTIHMTWVSKWSFTKIKPRMLLFRKSRIQLPILSSRQPYNYNNPIEPWHLVFNYMSIECL